MAAKEIVFDVATREYIAEQIEPEDRLESMGAPTVKERPKHDMTIADRGGDA